jgi:DNA-binding NarL/FixJ family response regulator
MAKIRVLVADDQEIIRDGLAFILKKSGDMEVVATAEDGAEAVELARRHRPDVVLMDIKMPRMDGIAATRAITAELPDTRVIILTTYDTDDLIYEGIRAGAQAYLLKGTRSARLVEAIRGVHAGDAQLDPAIALKVMHEFRRISPSSPPTAPSEPAAPIEPAAAEPEPSPLEKLSAREMEVLALLAQGLSNKDIAAHLYLTEGTVRNYVSSIMGKLHANDRTQVVIKAAQKRLIKLD